ncbi:hypothetical protein DCS_05709 [Drechmeria coniospora]|uniref:DUF6923 domain-containing protein n=1 Tax=Drechmeria coniospora TaxID=98403 RepID=A0A151GNW8_DRECN|nr:hypothetical protein DCS_05709 [Drechmeria coniospora]KYK58692.1 hypothetical protein DCS_05709 [Drechmeria coniospora]
MTGTVPGTSTAPSDVATTTTVFGTASGTSTITPPIDCTHPCTTSVIVTDVPSPLPCSVHGYIIQAGQNFYGIDLSTSQFSLIKSGIAPGVRGPGVINGIGYNVLDSYVYGFIRTNNDTGSVLIRIGAGGASTLIGSVVLNAANGFPAGPVNGTIRPNIGDITPDGQFWVTTGSGSAGGWAQIDLSPGATFATIVAIGTSPQLLNMPDWAYVPGGGTNYLYGLASSANASIVYLQRWNTVTHQYTVLADLGTAIGLNTFGAVFGTADGYLYGQNGFDGFLYRIKVNPPGSALEFIAEGPIPGDCTHPCTTSVIITVVPSPLPCSVNGYIIQNSTNFYGINLTTSQFELINANVAPGITDPGTINTIGYNVLDNYIYGVIRTNNDNTGLLIRIGAGGASVILQSVILNAANGFPAANTVRPNLGDVDPNGQYYGTTPAGGYWIQVDLAPGSPTFGTIVDSGSGSLQPFNMSDWAYVPGGGNYLYGFASSDDIQTAYLQRWDITTHEYSVVANLGPLPNNVFGAVFGAENGYLYDQNGYDGNLYRVRVNPPGALELVANGPLPGGNYDGARCINALNPI